MVSKNCFSKYSTKQCLVTKSIATPLFDIPDKFKCIIVIRVVWVLHNKSKGISAVYGNDFLREPDVLVFLPSLPYQPEI